MWSTVNCNFGSGAFAKLPSRQSEHRELVKMARKWATFSGEHPLDRRIACLTNESTPWARRLHSPKQVASPQLPTQERHTDACYAA
jgi:hypothetical protein